MLTAGLGKIAVGLPNDPPLALLPWRDLFFSDRDGNRYLKIAFHHAAIRAVQYFPEIRLEYQRHMRRKGKKIARARMAKELATIVYAMLSKEEAFNGTFCGHVLTRTKRPTWPRLASPPA